MVHCRTFIAEQVVAAQRQYSRRRRGLPVYVQVKVRISGRDGRGARRVGHGVRQRGRQRGASFTVSGPQVAHDRGSVMCAWLERC